MNESRAHEAVKRIAPRMSPARVGRMLERFGKDFAPYRVKLVETCGEIRTRAIEERTRGEYASLLPDTPRFEGRLNLFIQSRAFGLGLENPENIGQGCAVCMERFKRGRSTRMPANLEPIATPAALSETA